MDKKEFIEFVCKEYPILFPEWEDMYRQRGGFPSEFYDSFCAIKKNQRWIITSLMDLQDPKKKWKEITHYDDGTDTYCQAYKTRDEWEAHERECIKSYVEEIRERIQTMQDMVNSYNENFGENLTLNDAIHGVLPESEKDDLNINKKEVTTMKMTEKEYKKLISYFEFLNDKVEACYKRETDEVIKRLKKEYEQYVVKY